MSWFQKLCRDSGLMIHHIIKPGQSKREVRRTTEENQVSDKVTLRRTTIEEIEVKRDEQDTPKR